MFNSKKEKGGFFMASNAYFDQIMTLNGLDGFKDVIDCRIPRRN